MRLLAVDLGTRRLGFAICDAERTIASPYGIAELQHPADALDAVERVIGETGAGRVIVGHPLRLDRRAGPEAKAAAEFCERLCRAGHDAVLWDERLSTAEADGALRQAGLNRRERKARVDAVAAQRILAGYLAAHPRD